MLLTQKYLPKNTKEVIGQDYALSRLKSCVEENMHCLLYGINGVGKTSSVYALANEFGYEVVELNASNFRKKEDIDSVFGNAIKQKSLFKNKKIILIDEIDGMTGDDRGGIQSISDLISIRNFPVVLTGNDISGPKFKAIKKSCKMIEFKRLEQGSVFKILERICNEEKLTYNQDILRKIAYFNNGDARAAINDLQSLIGNKEVLDLEMYDREKKQDISNVLRIIFKTKDERMLYNILNNVDMDFDDLFLWLDENIPYEYARDDCEKAYYYLALADIFRKRIRSKQHYRFLTYINMFLSSGIANSKNEKNKNIVNYKRNERILNIWISNRRNNQKIMLVNNFANNLHMSKKKMLKELNFMRFII